MRQTMLFLTAILLATGCSCSGNHADKQSTTNQGIDTVPILIMQIQKCARLYTAEYHIHKIVTHDDVVKMKGSLFKQDINVKLPLGVRKVAIPMDATLKAYIDFGQFSEKNIERHGSKITIVLPDPKVELTSSKINQSDIKSFVGLVRSGFSDAEMTRYEQQGRESIIQSIPRLGILEMAQENAARTLIPMIKQMGYEEKDITIAFRKDYQQGGIRRFLEIGGNQ